MKSSYDSYRQVEALRKALLDRQKKIQSADKTTKEALEKLQKEIDAVAKGSKTAPGFGPVNRELNRLIFSVENADIRPAKPFRPQYNRAAMRWIRTYRDGRSSTSRTLSPSTKRWCKVS